MDIEAKLDKKDFMEALDVLKKMEKSLDDNYMKSTIRRKAKPMVQKMKRDSHSKDLMAVIGITTAKKKTPFVKVGVVKNNTALFPDISSYGLAAILEYGTVERYRAVKTAGIVTGRASTGRVPERKYA